MSPEDYLVGLAFFGSTLAAVTLACGLVVRRRLASLAGAPRILAYGVCVSAGLILVHLVPGALGVLSRQAVLLTALVVLVVASLIPPERATPCDAEQVPEERSGWVSWAIAAAAASLVSAAALGLAVDYATAAVRHPDALTFHLPNVARWIQSGSFWGIHDFRPDRALGYYPHNGNVLVLATVLPWKNDFLIRFVNLPFLALTGVAVYAIARELRAPTATSVLFGATVVAIPVVTLPTVDALSDTFMLAAFGTGVLFLLRHARTRRTADLTLAGLGLGLAMGTKWYGLLAVGAVLMSWAVGSVVSGTPVKATVRHGVVLGALIVASAGFWLLRNFVKSGNPVYPTKVAFGGLTIFAAPHDFVAEQFGFGLSDYAGKPDIWVDQILPSYLLFMALPAAVILVGMIPATAAALSAPRQHQVLILIGAAAVILFVYFFSPFTAWGPPGHPNLVGQNSRWAAPALLSGAAAIAWSTHRLRLLGPLIELAALVAVIHGIAKIHEISQGPDVWPLGVGLAIVLIGSFAVVWQTIRLFRRKGGGSTSGRRWAALAGSVLVLVLLAFIGYGHQRDFNDSRYRGIDRVVDWALANARADQRVGLAGGTQGTPFGAGSDLYPLFGPRLENEVAYVGQHVDGMLRPYLRQEPFTGALRRGHFDLVLLERGRGFRPGLAARHERWLRLAGYRPVAAAGALVLYRAPNE
jgi:hypothetical protein